MFKKINIKEIEKASLVSYCSSSSALCSFVAQLFIISAKNIYDFIFNNENFIVTIDIGDLSLT